MSTTLVAMLLLLLTSLYDTITTDVVWGRLRISPARRLRLFRLPRVERAAAATATTHGSRSFLRRPSSRSPEEQGSIL
jgi:hypothetical protein